MLYAGYPWGEFIMGFKIRIIALIALFMAPMSAWAVHPFVVEDTDPQGKGNYLFELNGDSIKDNSMKTTELTGILTVGAGEHTDLSVEVPYLKLNPSPVTDVYSSGKGDVQIRLKHQIFENEVKQSMAYQIYADMPTGDVHKGLGTNNLVWGAKLMDQQVCHDNILHASVGYEVYGRNMKKWHYAENYAFLFGLAVEHRITEKFWLLTELAGESRKESYAATGTQAYSRPFTFMAGFKYDISKSWYVDLAGRAGLNKYAEDNTVLLGTAWKF
jgi:hypothetical protein